MKTKYKNIDLKKLNHKWWFRVSICLLFFSYQATVNAHNLINNDRLITDTIIIEKNDPTISLDSINDIFVLIKKYGLYHSPNSENIIETEIFDNNSTVILIEEIEEVKKPLLALKTNLLFDAATILNAEVEVPIKQHWSIAAEWMFPWWLRYKNDENIRPSRLEVLCGTIEGRYWFGNRNNKRVLTGWFVGLHSGAGLYDLQWKSKGYQGEFFIAAGVSAGYAHRISKRHPNLSLEYSIGFGYFRSHYRHYEAFWGSDNKWHPLRLNSGHYTWIGPTRAKISLVWLLNYKTRKGGKL